MLTTHDDSFISRRASLKLIAAGALAAPCFAWAQEGQKAKPFRGGKHLKAAGLELAVQQYSFNRQLKAGELSILDFPKTVVEGTGIKALEYFNGHMMDRAGDTVFFEELRKRCDDLGASSTMMLCRSTPALDSPEASIRAAAVEGYKPWLEAMAILGGTTIRVDCRSKGDFEAQKKYATAGLIDLSDVAHGMGLGIVVENHGNHSGNGKWVADVMTRVNRRNCGTLPDFQNFTEYDPYLGVEEMMPFAKIVCAKSKEFDAKGDEVNVDYKRMMDIVLNSGYKGSIGIEFEGHGVDPVTGIIATARLLNRVVGQLTA